MVCQSLYSKLNELKHNVYRYSMVIVLLNELRKNKKVKFCTFRTQLSYYLHATPIHICMLLCLCYHVMLYLFKRYIGIAQSGIHYRAWKKRKIIMYSKWRKKLITFPVKRVPGVKWEFIYTKWIWDMSEVRLLHTGWFLLVGLRNNMDWNVLW